MKFMSIGSRVTGLVAATAFTAAVMAPATPASAHPHVWIYAKSDVVLNDKGEVTAVDIEWEFDEFYSLTAVEGMDTDGNGSYESSELQPLATENIDSLKDFGYFTVISAGGEAVELGTVTEYQSTFKEGRLSMIFRVPLAAPLDPKAAPVTYKIYDPSFYIAIEYVADNPVTALGDLPEGCALKVLQPAGDSDEAPVSEQSFVELLQTQDLGAIYSETVSIDCTSDPAS